MNVPDPRPIRRIQRSSQLVSTDRIVLDPRFQPRKRLDGKLFDPSEIDRMIAAGQARGFDDGFDPDSFDPLDVWVNGEDVVLLHGFHRVALASRCGIREVPIREHRCSREDALRIAARGNMKSRRLTPIEEAQIFKSRLDLGDSAEVIANDFDRRSPDAVLRRAAIAYLSPSLAIALRDGHIRVEYAEVIGDAAREGASEVMQAWLRDLAQTTKVRIEIFREVVRRLVMQAKNAIPVINGHRDQLALFDLPPDVGIATAKHVIGEATKVLRERDRWARFESTGQAILKGAHDQDEVVVHAVRRARARIHEINQMFDIVDAGSVSDAVTTSSEAPRFAQPILRWSGSKSWALDRILPIVRSRWRDDSILVEPFAGGAALTLACGLQGILSDIDHDLMRFYQLVKDTDCDAIYERAVDLRDEFVGEGGYKAVRDMWNDQSLMPDAATKAAMMIYLNRTCFNGLWRTNKSGKFNVPYGERSFDPPTLADIGRAHDALQKVTIDAGDGLTILKAIGHRPNMVVYLDPPFEFEGIDSLLTYARSITEAGSTVIMSAPCDNIALGAWCEKIEMSKTYAAGGGKRRKTQSEYLFASLA